MTENSFNIRPEIKIAFIQARWHSDIVDECRKAFIERFSALSNQTTSVNVFDVPGAFEAPLLAQKLAKSAMYDAIVVSAFVVDGGIYRHDFVAQAVATGLMQVQLETEVPILTAVLTPHHFHANDEHKKFYFDHFSTKGVEAADACFSILSADN